jgi:hypothetical protein
MIEISHDDDENLENQIELSDHKNDYLEDEEYNELEKEPSCISETQENKSLTTEIIEKSSVSKQRPVAPIDTAKLARTVRNILKDANIPQPLFANEVLGGDLNTLRNLFRYSKPWATTTSFNKRFYLRMNEWARSPEESIKVLQSKRDNEYKPVVRKDLSMISIDTQELVKTIKSTLKETHISPEAFATKVLGISLTSLEKQLNRPKPWTRCSIKWKNKYIKMYEWAKLPGSLEELNELMDSKYNDIDTIKLSSEITQILKNNKITQLAFGKEVLGLSFGTVKNMLLRPKKWSQSPYEWKRRYRKMHEWIKSPEESIIKLQALSNDKDNEDIDTVKLANEVRTRIKEEGITHWQFAKVVLGIAASAFTSMCNSSTPYALCRGRKRIMFRKLNEWIKSPEESIKLMKEELNSRTKVMDYKCSEDEIELDVFDLVVRVNKLMDKNRITKMQLSKMLDVSYEVLGELLHHPMPWIFLDLVRKNNYTKMNAWLIQNEVENELDESCDESTLENDLANAINTEQVASEFVQLLKIYGITQGYVASHKLNILTVYFEQLVSFPKPYAELKESERKIFQCMKKWMEPGEIKIMRLDYDAYLAKYHKLK